ncbi:S9 family peptidase [Streptomyces carpaticus]|uniref:Prolyl oligopeptidase family serine peptidase n=1 Tax=Streptomyces carpaticus TaxID=285558 RepID=A0ABV4ZNV4_9ACTN
MAHDRYGTWPSPIDAALVAAHDGKPEYLGAVGEELWWTAPRSAEGGRRALVRLRPDGGGVAETVLPAPWNARNGVIGYGGHPWAGIARPEGGPLIAFTDYGDQRVHAFEPDAPGGPAPRPLTPAAGAGGELRWCDLRPHPERGELWAVLEEHGEGGTVRRVPVAIPLDGSAATDPGALRELTPEGPRFVTCPRLSPDGRRAVWLAWDHPRMPWEGTELTIADLGPDGRLTGVRTLAGGPGEAIAQAEWAPDGTLLATTDRTGWWNPHRVDPDTGEAVNLCPREEEFAEGLWRIGWRWSAPLESGLIAVLHGTGGLRLGVLDPATGELADAPGPYGEWAPSLAVQGSRITGIAAGPHTGWQIVQLDTTTGHTRVLAEHHRDPVDPAYYPRPRTRVLTGPDGREIHATVYPPTHPQATTAAPEDERPPYVIWAHGGPTSRAPVVLDLEIAYFTSRGIGVAEVNYGGSTGFGRAYRERLRGQWGVVDVADCAAVARALADEGTADPHRLAIRGGSAGGWTAAASLTGADTAGLYRCGTISYPVLDLASWTGPGTHDFESRYLDSLIGPPAEVPERYRDRSPVTHADRITAPFLLLQGLDDTICPPEQADRLLAALAEGPGPGVPHAYLTFPGEGHGFRRAETIVTAVESELALYLTVFGIERPDAPELELRR